MTYKLSFDSIQVNAHPNQLSLVTDIRRKKQANISIVEGNGFPGCVKVAVHLSRDLWYLNEPQSIGVIADSDCSPVYQRMVDYLMEYLNTPCKKHNVNPQLSRNDSKQRLTLSYGQDPTMIMWTLEIPKNLEVQIANSLKRRYPNLRQYHGADEIIKAACKMLQISEEDVVRRSIRLFENERWFKTWCRSLKERTRRS